MRTWSTPEAEAAIAQAAAVNGQLLDQLMELENHVGHHLLRAATGTSRDLFATARAQLATLWSLYRRHSATLAALRDIRGRRRWLTHDDLSAVVGLLAGVDVPVEPRSTTDLVRAVEELAAQVRGVLDGADRVRTRLDPCLDRCDAHLVVALGHAAVLGADAGSVVAALQDRVAALRAVALTDPLALWTGTGVDATGADALEADCARVETELAGLAALRARADEALTEARAALSTVEHREWEVALRRAEVAVKIAAHPAGGERASAGTPPGSDSVRAAIERAGRRVETADWVGFGAAMADVRTAVADATARAERRLHEVGRPLRVRAELRGRLDLYHAKAAASGRAEDAGLDRLHGRAHDLLWTAPTDVAAAQEAVDAYRRAVNGPSRPARGEGGTT